MKSVSGKELARVLERHGWQLKRSHGSHHIYARGNRAVRLSVPVQANQPLKQAFFLLSSNRPDCGKNTPERGLLVQ